MEITVLVRHVYGNRVIYPACEKAKLFASLCGTKTLTYTAIKHIQKLGYTVLVRYEAVELS